LVTYGGMLAIAEAVARRLEDEEELTVEILVPSLLSPLPKSNLIDRLLDRPRVVVVEEAHHDFGVSAEIGASLLDRGFAGQFLRIGAPPVPIASARTLERQILPDEESLMAEILDLFA
jgi:2-oxoisovalerate dehydrogenase E1 component